MDFLLVCLRNAGSEPLGSTRFLRKAHDGKLHLEQTREIVSMGKNELWPKGPKDAEAADILRRLWTSIASREWEELSEVLAPDLRIEFPHSGSAISGAEEFVRFNRDYPGDWLIEAVRVHAISADLAVAEVTVSHDGKRLHAACFATAADGRVVHLREYWTEPVSRDACE